MGCGVSDLDWWNCDCCGGLMYATEPGLCGRCEDGETETVATAEPCGCPFCLLPLDPPSDAAPGAVWSSLMSTIDELIGEKS